ncbi:hypothetical protein FH972_021551 [Carpinus fangiana]|uniref:Phospholipase n=1 Tax=Carpinus fangiana TaxID=176857 RepID=A0A5N6KQ84_9ROSI|nr:hypothetical protein FH972_021551 [Carpinus fangiana]
MTDPGTTSTTNPESGATGLFKRLGLHDAKVKATHMKHSIGKFANLINPNHRHDEEHEKITDAKRQKVRDGHRFDSFAPMREGNKVKWYVDARDYFWAISIALDNAKETIYIEDWWLSPELFLRRPPMKNQHWRLDQVLKRRAEAGVQIYVVVYKEVEAAVSCNSNHTKTALRALCPPGTPGHGNIHVMRHPDHNVFENAGDMTFYWAHHEKFVVIDYNMAFVGGLDLCFGRYDTKQHPLADCAPAGIEYTVFPGQDFNNNRVMDFQSVNDWMGNQLSKAEYGRMPWHDVHMGLMGPSVYDIAEHFVLRWNFCKRDKYKRDERFDWLCMEGREGDDEDLIAVQRPKHPVGQYIHHPLTPLETKTITQPQGTVHAQLVRSSGDWSSGILTEHSIQNAYKETISKAEHFVYIENQFFITATGDQQPPILNTIGASIVEAVVRASKEGRKFRVIIVIPAIPGFAGDLRIKAAAGTRAIMDYQYKSIYRGEHSIFERCRAEGVDPEKHIFLFNLRSYDRINRTPAMKEQEKISGVTYTEVQRANAEEIMGEALHGSAGRPGHKRTKSEESVDPKAEEIRNEYMEKKKRFEDAREKVGLDDAHKFNDVDGDRIADSADSIAKDALLGQPKVSEELWNKSYEQQEVENFVQEELYPHDKLLIADDRIVICGSSNINDRSQCGYHDSELSIVLEDQDTIDSTMDGKPYKAARLAASLRRTLWQEHLGLIYPQPLDASDDPQALPPDQSLNQLDENEEHYKFVADPLSDDVWNMWTERATTNTSIFRSLFHADPDDNVRTWEDYDQFLPKGMKPGHLYNVHQPAEEVKASLDKIKGHLVWFPLHFLADVENMAERGMARHDAHDRHAIARGRMRPGRPERFPRDASGDSRIVAGRKEGTRARRQGLDGPSRCNVTGYAGPRGEKLDVQLMQRGGQQHTASQRRQRGLDIGGRR